MQDPPTIDTLIDIMARLRDPEGGCPWDLQQSFRTILPYTLEEAYEVRDPNLPYIGGPEWDPLRSDPRFQDLLRRMPLGKGGEAPDVGDRRAHGPRPHGH